MNKIIFIICIIFILFITGCTRDQEIQEMMDILECQMGCNYYVINLGNNDRFDCVSLDILEDCKIMCIEGL